jgi:hypothetical protein
VIVVLKYEKLVKVTRGEKGWDLEFEGDIYPEENLDRWLAAGWRDSGHRPSNFLHIRGKYTVQKTPRGWLVRNCRVSAFGPSELTDLYMKGWRPPASALFSLLERYPEVVWAQESKERILAAVQKALQEGRSVFLFVQRNRDFMAWLPLECQRTMVNRALEELLKKRGWTGTAYLLANFKGLLGPSTLAEVGKLAEENLREEFGEYLRAHKRWRKTFYYKLAAIRALGSDCPESLRRAVGELVAQNLPKVRRLSCRGLLESDDVTTLIQLAPSPAKEELLAAMLKST